MFVSDVMSRSVVTIDADETVQTAAERMKEQGIGVLPVTEGERLLGMLSDRDIAMRLAAPGFAAWSVRVREILTPGVVVCRPELDLAEAVRLMQQKSLRRLVVVDENGTMVGLLSLDDVLQLPPDERPATV